MLSDEATGSQAREATATSLPQPTSSTGAAKKRSYKGQSRKSTKRKGKAKGTSKRQRMAYDPDEYCTKCEQKYKEGDDWICCDICHSWLDRSCAGLDDDFLWNHYSGDDAQFVCPLCSKCLADTCSGIFSLFSHSTSSVMFCEL